MNTNSCGMYTVHLMRCAILGQKPGALPDGVALDDVISFGLSHRIGNIIHAALRVLDDIPKTKEWDRLCAIADFGVMHEARQQYYLETVAEGLEGAGIRYTVMKGSVIKGLYPTPDMRQSADIDILIDRSDAEKVKELMLGEGFECTAFGDNGTSDDYSIDKDIFFEFHRRLISNDYKWKEVCNEIQSRLVSSGGCEMRMTDEDYYIFMICHIAKHMKFGGIGLKAILDVWVYLREYKELDWGFINEQFGKCGLNEFHSNLLKLCDYWFEGKQADDFIKRMGGYIFISGWNGVDEQWLAGELSDITDAGLSKRAAFIKRMCDMIFWSRERMAVKYSILDKLPFLLPFCWVHRAVKAAFTKRDLVSEETDKYKRTDENVSRKINEFRNSIGL